MYQFKDPFASKQQAQQDAERARQQRVQARAAQNSGGVVTSIKPAAEDFARSAMDTVPRASTGVSAGASARSGLSGSVSGLSGSASGYTPAYTQPKAPAGSASGLSGSASGYAPAYTLPKAPAGSALSPTGMTGYTSPGAFAAGSAAVGHSPVYGGASRSIAPTAQTADVFRYRTSAAPSASEIPGSLYGADENLHKIQRNLVKTLENSPSSAILKERTPFSVQQPGTSRQYGSTQKATGWQAPSAFGGAAPQAAAQARPAVAQIRRTPQQITDTADSLMGMSGRYLYMSDESKRLLYSIYRDRQDELDVIVGRTTPDEWKRQQLRQYYDSLAQERAVTRQTVSQTDEPTAEKYKGPHGYTLDGDGQLVRNSTATPHREPPYSGTEEGKIVIRRIPRYQLDADGQIVWSRKAKEVPIFEKLTFSETYVGNRWEDDGSGVRKPYDPHTLDLSQKQQEQIYDMCSIADVDYYLVLAIIAHESGSRPYERNKSGAAGYMQVMPTYIDAYKPVPEGERPEPEGKQPEVEPAQYYNIGGAAKKLYDYAKERGADMDDLTDPLANIAYGIAMLHEHSKIRNGDRYATMLAYAGENLEDSKPNSTREILYYRDLLARAAGERTWYMGKPGYYSADGMPL